MRVGEHVTVQNAGDVSLVMGVVGDLVELIDALGDAKDRLGEQEVVLGGVRRCTVLLKVTVHEQDSRPLPVSAVDKELRQAPVADEVTVRLGDGFEVGDRPDLVDGEADSTADFRRGRSQRPNRWL